MTRDHGQRWRMGWRRRDEVVPPAVCVPQPVQTWIAGSIEWGRGTFEVNEGGFGGGEVFGLSAWMEGSGFQRDVIR